jgi:hypothetical protein
MRKYGARTTSLARVLYGLELTEGLGAFAETRELSTPLATVTAELDGALTKRLALQRPLVRSRAARRIVEQRANMVLRQFSRSVELADGGRRGPLHGALLPDGVTPLVVPVGAAQVAVLRALVTHLGLCRVPGAEACAADWTPRLTAAADELAATLATYDAARTAVGLAFQEELALRDAHARTVDRIIGLVRAALPGDRERQDALFPVISKSSRGEMGEEEDAGGGVGGEAGGGEGVV